MWLRLVNKLYNFLYINVATGRKPDLEVIHPISGEIYLHRWWIIPRNRFFNMYLHYFDAGDVPAFHDHPWMSIGMILCGDYVEYTPVVQPGKDRFIEDVDLQDVQYFGPGQIKFRNQHFAHYITKLNKNPTWTLFITGPYMHKWGFYKKDGTWIRHDETGRNISYD